MGTARFVMAPAKHGPQQPAKQGINWKRQGIIFLISLAIAIYMVARTGPESKGPGGRNAAPVSATTNLQQEITRIINMRAYEIVHGVNHKEDPKFIIVKNTAKPPEVAAEFIYSTARRSYTANVFDDDLREMRALLRDKRIVL